MTYLDPEPDRRFANLALLVGQLAWGVILGLSLLGLVISGPFIDHETHTHTSPVLVVSIIAALAMIALIRAARGHVLGAAVLGTLTIAFGLFVAVIGLLLLAFPFIGLGGMLLTALPPLARHAAWRKRNRTPELPRARVVA